MVCRAGGRNSMEKDQIRPFYFVVTRTLFYRDKEIIEDHRKVTREDIENGEEYIEGLFTTPEAAIDYLKMKGEEDPYTGRGVNCYCTCHGKVSSNLTFVWDCNTQKVIGLKFQ